MVSLTVRLLITRVCMCAAPPSPNARLSIQADLFLNCLVWVLSLLVLGTSVALKWLLTPNCLWQNLTLPVAADNPQTHISKTHTFSQRCKDPYYACISCCQGNQKVRKVICSSASVTVLWKWTQLNGFDASLSFWSWRVFVHNCKQFLITCTTWTVVVNVLIIIFFQISASCLLLLAHNKQKGIS